MPDGAIAELWARRSRVVRDVVGVFVRADLLVEAGALAFRILVTLIPAALFAIGLAGFLGLEEAWRQDAAPDLKRNIPPASFEFIDQAVTKVLTSKNVFWVTLGAMIAIWEASAVVRGAGKILNRIYDVEEERSLRTVVLSSLPLAALGIALLLAAIVVVRFGALLVSDVLGDALIAEVISFLVRWSIAAALLFALIGVTLRIAPQIERPDSRISFGAGVIVVSWLVTTFLFAFYLENLASYASFFGNLATVFVLAEYLYMTAFIFITGVAVDAVLRKNGS